MYICRMNVDKLLRKYFTGNTISPTIEVFDSDTIYDVYADIVHLLNSYPDIELSVLQGLGYCFYEVLDNVLTHSEKECGTVIMRYLPDENRIQVLVADDGIGIHRSLLTNPVYKDLTEREAVERCILDKVTDGKGMGFGLYSTSRLIDNAGIRLEIHSGCSLLVYEGRSANVVEQNYWRGTIVYFELHSDREINPNEVVENRTDCESEYNDLFNDTENLEELW